MALDYMYCLSTSGTVQSFRHTNVSLLRCGTSPVIKRQANRLPQVKSVQLQRHQVVTKAGLRFGERGFEMEFNLGASD